MIIKGGLWLYQSEASFLQVSHLSSNVQALEPSYTGFLSELGWSGAFRGWTCTCTGCWCHSQRFYSFCHGTTHSLKLFLMYTFVYKNRINWEKFNNCHENQRIKRKVAIRTRIVLGIENCQLYILFLICMLTFLKVLGLSNELYSSLSL